MTDDRAREILADISCPNGSLLGLIGGYIDWSSDQDTAILDGHFTADELEAIAIWMRTHGKEKTA